MVKGIPKSAADKALVVIGLLILVADYVAKLSLGTGITGDAVGVGFIAKGMEEFLTGDTVQAIKDVFTGAKQVEASTPQAKIDALKIAADPIPVVVEVAPALIVAVEAEQKKDPQVS
jgi:multisubunit Na+/H+ antiporter MnhC subunit